MNRRTFSRLLLGAILAAPFSVGAQALLRRAERNLYPACRTVGTGAAQELFSLSVSSNVSQDRKEIWIQSMDVVVATNSIRISTYAATVDAAGYPLVGYANPMILRANQGIKIFVRRSSSQVPATVDVCGLQVD